MILRKFQLSCDTNLVEASDRRVVRCCVQAFGRLPGFLGYGLHGVDAADGVHRVDMTEHQYPRAAPPHGVRALTTSPNPSMRGMRSTCAPMLPMSC